MSLRPKWQLLLIAALTLSCGHSSPSLHLSASPNPIPLHFFSGGGVMPANFPPSLSADWSILVASELGGQGTIATVIVDGASGEPLTNLQGTISGPTTFALAPNGTASVKQAWECVLRSFSIPSRLAFQITVRFTDARDDTSEQVLTVSEQEPRDFTLYP